MSHEAFEKLIDSDPLEANSHLVYADWLEENGHSDEAAFRRAMGEWFQTADIGDHTTRAKHTRDLTGRMPEWRITPSALPSGVKPQYIEVVNGRPDHVAIARRFPSTGRLTWKSYRGMEEAFRRAFHANRKANPEHFARKLNSAIKPTGDL